MSAVSSCLPRKILRGITELKGKSVGVKTAQPDLLTLMAPPSRAQRRQGHPLGHRPQGQAARIIRGGQDRCLRRLCPGAAGAARPACRPCHRHHDAGPPVVAVFQLHVDGQPGIRPQSCGSDQAGGARSSKRRISAPPSLPRSCEPLSIAASSIATTTRCRR